MCCEFETLSKGEGKWRGRRQFCSKRVKLREFKSSWIGFQMVNDHTIEVVGDDTWHLEMDWNCVVFLLFLFVSTKILRYHIFIYDFFCLLLLHYFYRSFEIQWRVKITDPTRSQGNTQILLLEASLPK